MIIKCLNRIIFLQTTLSSIIKLHYMRPDSVVLLEYIVIYITDYYHDQIRIEFALRENKFLLNARKHDPTRELILQVDQLLVIGRFVSNLHVCFPCIEFGTSPVSSFSAEF